jgi:hypothetical protein
VLLIKPLLFHNYRNDFAQIFDYKKHLALRPTKQNQKLFAKKYGMDGICTVRALGNAVYTGRHIWPFLSPGDAASFLSDNGILHCGALWQYVGITMSKFI